MTARSRRISSKGRSAYQRRPAVSTRYVLLVLIPHRWPGAAFEALLVARPNKFLAVCRLGRRTIEAHVPDRGRCLDLLIPGRTVAVVAASGPVRKTRYTTLLARSGTGVWVSLDPAGALRLVEEALRRELLPS